MAKKSGTRSMRGRQQTPPPPASAERQSLAEMARLLGAGALEPAAALNDAFLLAHPDHVEALHLGGIVALRLNRLDRAIERLRRAGAIDPRNAFVLADLGVVLAKAGRRSEAETAYRAALALRPDLVEITLNLGDLLATVARDEEAAECYAAVLARRPEMAEVQLKLAQLRLKLRQPREAMEGARRALALKPDMVAALQTLGSALDTLGQFDEAVEIRRRAIALAPAAGFAQYDLGMTQMHHGRLDEAAESFRRAIALEPERGSWHRALSMVISHGRRDAEMAAMERLRRSNTATPEDRMHACFGLGKALDDLGDYAEAFDYFLEGNRLKRERLNYSSAETDRLFDAIKAAFTPERFAALAGSGASDPTPIFVLGMPRSGTSLVEQVLASHPEVQGGGEFRLVNQIVGGFANGPGFPIAAALDAVRGDTLRRMGERYVGHVRGLSQTARFITDKLPGNFIMIGMIRLMLPNATIIHCQRDPIDTSLSLFKNYFAGEHLRYAYDLTEIGHYHRRYMDLMAHWHRVLPGFVYDVSYEALVADFDTEAKKLVARCGLEWREECRQFFAARRPVDTASAVQVRRPIYATSIGQAARYGDKIRPLLDALAG
ncbi:MAG: sulfotransferase [Devosia sp.]|nr:sulfotransferase [Devosia sp.]